MKVDKNHLEASLQSLNHELPYIRDWVNHLILFKGIPGFVQEFKKLKAWALQLIAGNCNFSQEWFKSSVYCGYRIPTRYRELFRYLVCILIRVKHDSGQLPSYRRSLKLILSALNIYYTVNGPYEPDKRKQVRVALSPAPELPQVEVDRYKQLLRLACYAVPGRLSSKLTDLGPTGQTVALAPGKNGSWGEFVSTYLFTALAKWDQTDSWSDLLTPDRFKLHPSVTFQGNLTFLGESGGKTRMVLVGNPLLQSQLLGLKRQLLDILRKFPTDLTFRQEEGVAFIKSSMQKRKTIFSVDLSDATWNFPSSLQEHVLCCLGVNRKVRDLVFRTPVFDPLSKKLHLVVKGQAMGLGPSFPLFSLTHNLVLLALCKVCGEIPASTFRVLGDDVVITSESVHELYLEFLEKYSVPISISKTLSSKDVGEVSGKVIFMGCDITPIKWRELSWNSLPTLYWEYRNLLGKNFTYLFCKKANISLAVIGPLPKKFGGLSLRFPSDSTPKIKSLRCGILESLKEGLMFPAVSSGVRKVPNWNLESRSPFLSLLTPSVLRTLDKMLVNDSLMETPYGILPSLSPTPTKVLSQLGISINLIPEREVFEWEQAFRFRFKRSKRIDWNNILAELSGLEVISDKKTTEQSIQTDEDEQEIIQSFFYR